jgi:hypothetical protein
MIPKRKHVRTAPNSPAQIVALQYGSELRSIRGLIAILELARSRFYTPMLANLNIARLQDELEEAAKERYETKKKKLPQKSPLTTDGD